MEEEKKKAWTTPTLTPIVRRKPEEGILETCKTTSTEGPESVQEGCRLEVCWGCPQVVSS